MGNEKNESMYDRFVRSAKIDADNWRDPQHDLEAIRLANSEERSKIERFMLARGVRHMIDVEALALLGTPPCQQVLLEAFATGRAEIRAAVAQAVPEWIADHERKAELVARIAECDAYEGLSLTLDQIEASPSAEVIDAMLIRIVQDPGTAAVHFAGLLLYLHDQASEPFDWEQRPFLLQFNSTTEQERLQAFRDLCARIKRDPESYLSRRSVN